MSRKIIITLGMLLIVITCFSACGEVIDGETLDLTDEGGTNSLVLSWTAPTTNEDGSSLTDLDGYRLYYGNESGNYLCVIDVGSYTSAEIDGLSNDTWYMVVTAYDYFGNESGYSNEINHTFN